jgi:hypothetical protein
MNKKYLNKFKKLSGIINENIEQDGMTSSQMLEYILSHNLKNGFGKMTYEDAKDIAYHVDKWILTEINLDNFDWIADPLYQRKDDSNLYPIVLKLYGNKFDVLDGKHRIGMEKANGKKTMKVWLGDFC